MVYVPQGTYPYVDQAMRNPAYSFSARNRSVFDQWFLDEMLLRSTNNEYRQFVYWVRDSVVARNLAL
jgi:hypothetical protein